jgi:hypothetical protein
MSQVNLLETSVPDPEEIEIHPSIKFESTTIVLIEPNEIEQNLETKQQKNNPTLNLESNLCDNLSGTVSEKHEYIAPPTAIEEFPDNPYSPSLSSSPIASSELSDEEHSILLEGSIAVDNFYPFQFDDSPPPTAEQLVVSYFSPEKALVTENNFDFDDEDQDDFANEIDIPTGFADYDKILAEQLKFGVENDNDIVLTSDSTTINEVTATNTWNLDSQEENNNQDIVVEQIWSEVSLMI